MLKKYLETLQTDKDILLNQYNNTSKDLTKRDYVTANIFREKNKFSDILSSEETRVKLDNQPFYYINANHMLDNYIATQQPEAHTFNDFWEMVYEKNCSLIVNLSGNNSYLPLNSEIYGNHFVKVINITDKNYIKIRNIHVSNVNHSDIIKVVYHITFTLWPDYGVPTESDFTKLFDAISMIDYMSHTGPIVVHCRAGVGRTGTFILIHYILKKSKKNEFSDPIDILIQMRTARCNMVQEPCQFEFGLKFICNHLNKKSHFLNPIQLIKSKLTSSFDENNNCKTKYLQPINSIKSAKKLSTSAEVSI